MLVEAGGEALLANHLRRCEVVIEEFWPDIIAPASFDEKLKAADMVLKYMKREADLFGLDYGKRVDVTISTDEKRTPRAEKIADNVERFMELADKMVRDGIGSGRVMLTTGPDGLTDVVDADLVDEDVRGDLRPFSLAELSGAEGAPIRTPEPPATPSRTWREFLAERQTAKVNERVPESAELAERRPGRWVKGKFIPLEEGVEVVST